MTSVPQLPLEMTPQGDMPRTRSNKPGEDANAVAFAALFAQAMPQAPVGPRSLPVEGESAATEDATASAVADGGTAAKPGVAALVVNFPAAAPAVAPGERPTAGPLPQEPEPAAAEPLQERPAVRSAVEQAFIDTESVDVEAQQQNDSPPVRSKASQTNELEKAAVTPAAKASQEPRPAEHIHAEHPAPEPADLPSAVTVRVEPQPTARTERKPHDTLTPHDPQPSRHAAAAEPRRVADAPEVAQPPRVDSAPVIAFQVRNEAAAQRANTQRQAADWTRAVQSRPLEAESKLALQQAVAAPPVEAVANTKAAENAVPAVAVPLGEPEPALTKDIRPARLQPAQHNDVGRAAPLPLAAAAQGDAPSADEQAEDGNPGDAPPTPDAPEVRKTQPAPPSPSAPSLSAEPQTDSEASKPAQLKAVAVATPAGQQVHVPQFAAVASATPLATLNANPPEAARPDATANQPSEPEIAAKLQQQSGRTTLNVVLQDERLGRVALQLVERGGWIETAIRASDPRTAQALSHGAAGLIDVLQQRGLTVATGGGAAAWDAQDGQRRDSPQRDAESQRRRYRMRRTGGEFEGALARTGV